MSAQPSLRMLDWALLVLLSVLWGGSFFFSKVALADWPPFTVVLVRVALAALALGLYLRARGRRLPTAAPVWRAFFVMGLLNNILPFSLLFWGQTQIASGLASILNATTPVFAILVTKALAPETEITANRLAGVALGLAGVAVLMGGDALSSTGFAVLPMLACLGATLSYGAAGFYGQRFQAMGIAPATGAFGQLAASSLLMIPVVCLSDRPWTLPLPGPASLAALVALALLSTALAYVIYFRSLSVIGQLNTSMVTLMIPGSAILLGSLVLGERLSANHYAGLALIALGLLAIDGRLWRRLRRR
ncbi:DMT family transporter [Pseudooceanicola sp. CBS1P-1]|uniref:EamA family transporter n=1 Tax=Pseudooceanicola albus TaxID=2692189 RepID=A0A6L7G2G6_9RHOB|nr:MULTISPECIES: DMT family transporter [Pseudooceanicola]MBT9384573.1 DMT family transporter [Pseudooceanicola endophyticus]MXN18275.1 EamA family transporter [Pseudooceanicola albus]